MPRRAQLHQWKTLPTRIIMVVKQMAQTMKSSVGAEGYSHSKRSLGDLKTSSTISAITFR